MNTLLRLLVVSSAAVSCGAWAAGREDAAEQCEKAVARTVERVRGKEAHDVQFVSAKRSLTTDGDEIGVKGEGHYRRGKEGTVPFSYSCAFNASNGATSGAVFRETGAAPAEAKPWQPDLSNVSPEACETAVAALLKDKYPRVTGISFRSETRALKPAGDDHVGLEGRGMMQRAEGMNAQGFGYRCEFDARSGKVTSARESE